MYATTRTDSGTNTPHAGGGPVSDAGLSIRQSGQQTLAAQVGDVGPRHSEWAPDVFEALLPDLTAAYRDVRDEYDALDAWEVYDALLDVPDAFAAALGRWSEQWTDAGDDLLNTENRERRREHIRRTLTRPASGPHRCTADALAAAYAEVFATAGRVPTLVCRLDGPAWEELDDRRTGESALDLLATLGDSVDLQLVVSPRLRDHLKRRYGEWVETHLTERRDSPPRRPAPDTDAETTAWDAWEVLDRWGGQTARVRLLATLEADDSRTVAELKADPRVDVGDATVDRYLARNEDDDTLATAGFVEIEERTNASNRVRLTEFGETAQRRIDAAYRVFAPNQTELSEYLTESFSTVQVQCSAQSKHGEGGEDSSRSSWEWLARTDHPDADASAGYVQWLGDDHAETSAFALHKALRAGHRVEGVTCVDAPVQRFDDGRVVYLSCLNSELQVVTQWGGSAATLARLAKALSGEAVWGKILQVEDVGEEFENLAGMEHLSKSERLDHLRRGGQVGWSFHEDDSEIDYWSLRDRLFTVGTRVIECVDDMKDGDAETKSALYRDAHGLITTMTRLLSLAGVDVTIFPLLHDVDQLTREESRRRDFFEFFREVAKKQACYGIHSAWRQIGETRENKLQYRKSLNLGHDEPTADLTASWVVCGPDADRLQEDLAAALDDVEVREAVAEGREKSITISIPVVAGNTYGAVRSTVESILSGKGFVVEDRTARRVSRLLIGVLGREPWHCSPVVVAEALLRLARPDYNRDVTVHDVIAALGALHHTRLFPRLGRKDSVRRMVAELLRSDEPVSKADLAEVTSTASVSRNIGDLETLALVERVDDAYLVYPEPWWATESGVDSPHQETTPELRTTWIDSHPEDFLLELVLEHGDDVDRVEWADPDLSLSAVSDAHEWLAPWIPWIRCLLEAPPDVDDPRHRGVTVTVGAPLATATNQAQLGGVAG